MLENLKWHEDSSNKKMIYLRNNLRHSIIPLLKDTNPSFMDSFYKTQKYLNESQSGLNISLNTWICFKTI